MLSMNKAYQKDQSIEHIRYMRFARRKTDFIEVHSEFSVSWGA